MTPAARRRPRPPPSTTGTASPGDRGIHRGPSARQGPLRFLLVKAKVFFVLGVLLLLSAVVFFVYENGLSGAPPAPAAMRVVTPLPAPRMMDLDQFQGEHKESLYWGTYRPHIYFGMRARTPQSLLVGMMWLGIKNGQYHLRHVCQDSDDLRTYGWVEHNGRDYGRHVIDDNGLSLTTSFIKEKGEVSGYGGDWAIRIDAQHESSVSGEVVSKSMPLFFYVADEAGIPINMGMHETEDSIVLLASGSRGDVGGWQLSLKSVVNKDIHAAGFKTLHMHNLTELVQRSLVNHVSQTGRLHLPDLAEVASNVMVYQISLELPGTVDIAFLSDIGGISLLTERINSLTGAMLTGRLHSKQKEFNEKYDLTFNVNEKANYEENSVGKAAIANLIGGIGYFYGQSKILLPKDLIPNNGKRKVSYWSAALFTAVPSRSYFPRGFLWDEGFHQMMIWRWDVHICMDIIGHWLDLLNMDGWIPREQILGAEALSKVPEEFVFQHPSNGNPPTLFLALRDIANALKANKFSLDESKKISKFLERAYHRLHSWFQWFNTTQSGKYDTTFYWHGRDSTTLKELNPKTLTSGLDDYPRASHPSDDERHVDLRCWILLAADCMCSMAERLGLKGKIVMDYILMSKQLLDFEILNQWHLDDASGAYFDYGNHSDKVRLRWYEIRNGNTIARELRREILEQPRLQLVQHVGYVSLFPFMMGIIPPASWQLEKQLDHISNHSLWTDYGLRSLSTTSALYMKHNTEHDPPYWRGAVWINMNYLILSALHHYAHEEGPYKARSGELYKELRLNLIRNIVRNYRKTGFLWENYDQDDGKGRGTKPFTGWTSLVVLMMAESYPDLHR